MNCRHWNHTEINSKSHHLGACLLHLIGHHVPLSSAHCAGARHCGARIELAVVRDLSQGPVGLMQLMPATAKRLGVADRCDLDQNVSGGVRYLAWLMRRFHNDLRLVAAAYYAGEDTIGRRGLAYRNPGVVAYVSAIRTTYLREAGNEPESKNTTAKGKGQSADELTGLLVQNLGVINKQPDRTSLLLLRPQFFDDRLMNFLRQWHE